MLLDRENSPAMGAGGGVAEASKAKGTATKRSAAAPFDPCRNSAYCEYRQHLQTENEELRRYRGLCEAEEKRCAALAAAVNRLKNELGHVDVTLGEGETLNYRHECLHLEGVIQRLQEEITKLTADLDGDTASAANPTAAAVREGATSTSTSQTLAANDAMAMDNAFKRYGRWAEDAKAIVRSVAESRGKTGTKAAVWKGNTDGLRRRLDTFKVDTRNTSAYVVQTNKELSDRATLLMTIIDALVGSASSS